MRTLVYRMTHSGDPDARSGVWGVSDCMGRVRAQGFQAVIGIGGKTAIDGLAGRLVWIGIDPSKSPSRHPGWRGPEVRFRRFRYFGDEGPFLIDLAPHLAQSLYLRPPRIPVQSSSLSPEAQREIAEILAMAVSARHSQPRRTTMVRRCRVTTPRCR